MSAETSQPSTSRPSRRYGSRSRPVPQREVECGLPRLDVATEVVDLGAGRVELGPPARGDAVVPGRSGHRKPPRVRERAAAGAAETGHVARDLHGTTMRLRPKARVCGLSIRKVPDTRKGVPNEHHRDRRDRDRRHRRPRRRLVPPPAAPGAAARGAADRGGRAAQPGRHEGDGRPSRPGSPPRSRPSAPVRARTEAEEHRRQADEVDPDVDVEARPPTPRDEKETV